MIYNLFWETNLLQVAKNFLDINQQYVIFIT